MWAGDPAVLPRQPLAACFQVEAEYQGSDEEKRDLLRYYTKFQGDMHQARLLLAQHIS